MPPPLPDRSAVLGNEITGLALMLVEVLGKPFPSLKQIYTPQVTAAAGEAIARVCVKHGWLPNGLSGGYGEELAAAMILLPLAYQTYQGVNHDLARMKMRQAGDQPQAEAAAAPEQEKPQTPAPAPTKKNAPRKPTKK